MSGWTAEGGVLGTETDGRTRYYWTRLHMAECGTDRSKNYVPRYQNQMQQHPKAEVASGNVGQGIVFTMRGTDNISGEERCTHSVAL
jgi:hypothetical protein